MENEQFWRMSYDAGLTDLDPQEWEISYVDAIKETFEQFPDQLAFAFMGVKVKLKEFDQYANRFAHMLISHGLKIGGIGLPILNTDIILLDPITGKKVSPGKPGEICVKGPQVMVGYYKNPEETKKAIDENGYLHTGDIAIQDEEGYLRLVDRSKDMIIVSGFKVFSKKVEDILTRHPAVESAAIVGIPDPKHPGSELVKAYIMLASGYTQIKDEATLKADIIKMAAEKLAPYEVPKIIEFCQELPLTTVSKVDKKLLRAEARAGQQH